MPETSVRMPALNEIVRFASASMIAASGAGCATSRVPEVVSEPDPASTTIVVEVETEQWDGEMLYLGVFQSAESFLEVDQWAAGVTVPVTSPLTTVVFEDLPALPTAVSGFIDIKRDETLTRNIIGLPLEPWGFSNDISIFITRPRFEQARVEVEVPETVIRFAMGTSLDRSAIRRARSATSPEEASGRKEP